MKRGIEKNANAFKRLSNALKRLPNTFEFFLFPFSWGRSHIVSLPTSNSAVYISEIDECFLQTHNCSSDAQCYDTRDSFNCSCNSGYQGDGVNCPGTLHCEQDWHHASVLGPSLCIGVRIISAAPRESTIFRSCDDVNLVNKSPHHENQLSIVNLTTTQQFLAFWLADAPL